MSDNTINDTLGVFGNWVISIGNSSNTSTGNDDIPVTWPMTATTAPSNDTSYNYTGFMDDVQGIVNASDKIPVQMKQVWFTLRIGLGVSFVTLFAFALAMRFRITHIAPRCEARPRNVIYNPNRVRDPSQDKGNPFLLGWVWWVMSLPYSEMLAGVPGTGTRDGGLKGSMLTVNLDHLILLRFNALCLKISVAAMLIYCSINLPVYFYSRCSDVPLGDIVDELYNCSTMDANYTLTSYSRFTLANIPDLGNDFFDTSYHVASFRIYVVVLTSWLVLWFACFELFHEWIDVLAIRRVYYHEMDMWKDRKKQLKETMMIGDSKGRFNKDDDIQANPRLHNREAWIPHPEQRDTPPNIELYSVLVGGVPSRPKDIIAAEDVEALAADNVDLDWQMSVTSAFFDACVPNQPGFTSSVAAVTILPSATELATAWNEWSKASKRISRLRFIRRRIRELGYVPRGQKLEFSQRDDSTRSDPQSARVTPAIRASSNVFSSDRRREYTAEILGGSSDDDTDDAFWQSLDLGPEQIAVYSMEMSKSLAGCCPYGPLDQRISYCKDVDKLLEMEEDAVEAVNEAYERLKDAGNNAAYAKRERADLADLFNEKMDNLGLDLHAKSIRHGMSDVINKTGLSVHAKNIREGTKQIKEGISTGISTSLNKTGITELKTTVSTSVSTSLRSVGIQKTPNSSAKKRRDGSFAKSFKGLESDVMKRRETLAQRLSNVESGEGDLGNGTSRSLNGLTTSEDCETALQDDAIQEVSTHSLQSDPMRGSSVRFRSSRKVASEVNADPDPWEVVETLAEESKNNKKNRSKPYRVSAGVWTAPSLRRTYKGLRRYLFNLFLWSRENSDEITDVAARESTYAVVTFTSRQAAIAARKCLADGRGADSFKTMNSLPVPPLADSAAFNVFDCRGFTRPVTIGLNESQKNWRKSLVIACVAIIYVFYTVPITWAAGFFTETLYKAYPDLSWDKDAVSGFLNSTVLSGFLALLPDLFLFLANFGSNATSLVASENVALQFYWYFMVIFAFVGTSIAKMAIQAWDTGSFNVTDNLQKIARTIPVETSFLWLNWTIQKTTMFHLPFYLFQALTWVSAMFGANCCARMFRGGGSGSRLPYRIYVESGTVLMFALALAPAAPIVAPFVVLYFLVCSPMLRYVVIFTYKPLYDAGGARWPFLFEMVIVCLLSGQILLATMVFLKQAVGPAIVAIIPFFPTLMFRRMVRGRFLDAYNDAALVQTSLLDGWDVGPEAEHWNFKRREQFRRFLVDSHKASYVPVCIAAVNTLNIITAEPALAQPLTAEEVAEEDAMRELAEKKAADVLSPANSLDEASRMTHDETSPGYRRGHLQDRRKQFGALNRRHLVSGRDIFAGSPPESHPSMDSASTPTSQPSSRNLMFTTPKLLSTIPASPDEEEEEELEPEEDHELVPLAEFAQEEEMHANDDDGSFTTAASEPKTPGTTARSIGFGQLLVGSDGEADNVLSEESESARRTLLQELAFDSLCGSGTTTL